MVIRENFTQKVYTENSGRKYDMTIEPSVAVVIIRE